MNTAEAIYNPWREFVENCISGDNYFRASEYEELLGYIDGLLQQVSALSASADQPPKCEKCGGSVSNIVGIEGLVMCNYCDHAQDSAPQASQPDVLEQIADLFNIGSDARKNHATILANVKNCKDYADRAYLATSQPSEAEIRAKALEEVTWMDVASEHEGRYRVEHRSFGCFDVKCGTGTRILYSTKFGRRDAELVAAELTTAFHDGIHVAIRALAQSQEQQAPAVQASQPSELEDMKADLAAAQATIDDFAQRIIVAQSAALQSVADHFDKKGQPLVAKELRVLALPMQEQQAPAQAVPNAAEIRAKALDEAAKACEIDAAQYINEEYQGIALACAESIRALAQQEQQAPAVQEALPGGAKDALNTILWLYRRLPREYGRPPGIEVTVSALSRKTGVEVAEFLSERGEASHPAPAQTGEKTK